MTLSLTWITYKNERPPFTQSITIQSVGTIGRAKDNDFVLHDPDKFASRYHARIISQNGAYYLEDTSAAGTIVNDNIELQNGHRFELQHGDTLLIGDCVMVAEIQDSSGAYGAGDYTSPQTVRQELTQPTRGYESNQQFAAPAPSTDSFDIDDFFSQGGEAPQPAPGPSGVPQSLSSVGMTDSFTPPGAQQSAPFDDIDEIFSRGMGEVPSAQPQQQEREVITRHRSPDTGNNQDTAALRAFLKELDMDPSQLIGQNKVDVMRVAGIILKTLTEGMMGVLSARDSLKMQLNMDRTQIKQVKNNPLKFSSSPQEAMARMLTQEQGYMDPVSSAREAVDDAKAHQMAMVSGLNAAIANTISAFDPNILEKEFDVGFSISKDAKHWQLFAEKFEKIAKSAESDSNNIFTNHFRESYEIQIRRLLDK